MHGIVLYDTIRYDRVH